MKTVAIIQARMGSTRLPGKMMMLIVGKPVVQHVIEHVTLVKSIQEIWLATTLRAEDDILAQWAKEQNVYCYRGSADDVLDRYYKTACLANAESIVRITGDCPLIDPAVVDHIVQSYLRGGYDYVSNIHPPTFPDGLDTEVFSMATLEHAWHDAILLSEREHVTPYIWKHPALFRLKNISNDIDYSSGRWTLDTKEDFEFIKIILEACIHKHVEPNLSTIIKLLTENPKWNKINTMYKRNEGYEKSVQADII